MSASPAARPSSSLTSAAITSAYTRWAPIYDLVFRAVMGPGRRAGVALATQKPNRYILDVGVGTGLELPLFKSPVRVVGIDLCEPMLRIAHRRVLQQQLTYVEGLAVMDALSLSFPDQTFDAVLAPYVLTVVPDPHRMLDELMRVVRPGGDIILVNHLSASKGPLAKIESWMARHKDLLGWSPVFPWSILSHWLTLHPSIQLVERRSLAPLGLFHLIHLRRLSEALLPREAA